MRSRINAFTPLEVKPLKPLTGFTRVRMNGRALGLRPIQFEKTNPIWGKTGVSVVLRKDYGGTPARKAETNKANLSKGKSEKVRLDRIVKR